MNSELLNLINKLESKITYEERRFVFEEMKYWFEDDKNKLVLLEAIEESIKLKNLDNLMILLIVLQSSPDKRFTKILCDILEMKEYNFMEGVADALFDIADERCINTVTKILLEYEIDEDLG